MIAPPYGSPRRGRLRLLLFTVFALLALWLVWEAVTWPDVAALADAPPTTTAFSEDIRFFSHNGFDDNEIKAALQDAWEDKELPRGASTITQQVAKNLWLSPSYNPLRKVKEAILTRQ